MRILFLFLLMFSVQANAVDLESGKEAIDSISKAFLASSTDWGAVMRNFAINLFWILALISMVFRFIPIGIRGGNINELLAEIVKFFMHIGGWYFLLTNGVEIAQSVIKTFAQMGGVAGGFDQAVTPATIIDLGASVFSNTFDRVTWSKPIDALVGLVIAGIIAKVMLDMAVEMVIIMVSGLMLIYGGVFLVAAAGFDKTVDIAMAYYKKVLAVAVEGFGLILVVGVGLKIINDYLGAMGDGVPIKKMFVLMCAAYCLKYVAFRVPKMLSSIVSVHGAVGTGGNFGAAAIASAATAMTMAATAMTGATKAMVSTAASTAGAGRALGEAVASSGGDGIGALARSGNVAKALANGAKQVGGNALNDVGERMGSAWNGKVSSSVGSKIAEAIKAQRQAAGSNELAGSFRKGDL